jgi:hypothetical protein
MPMYTHKARPITEIAGLSLEKLTSSINGQILSLEQAIQAHVGLATKEGRDPHETRTKCIEQLAALRTRLV